MYAAVAAKYFLEIGFADLITAILQKNYTPLPLLVTSKAL